MPILSHLRANSEPLQLFTTFPQLLLKTKRRRKAWNGIKAVWRMSWRWRFYGTTGYVETRWNGQNSNPHDEAHWLILYRSHDIKLQKTGDFGAKCTKFIPFAWKYPQAILRASCRKAGCAFLLQREFSPLAVRFWEPIASLDRQNRSNFRRKISARETYSPPPFILFVKKMFIMHDYTESYLDKLMNFHWKLKKYQLWYRLRCRMKVRKWIFTWIKAIV